MSNNKEMLGDVMDAASVKAAIETNINISVELRRENGQALLIHTLKAKTGHGWDGLR